MANTWSSDIPSADLPHRAPAVIRGASVRRRVHGAAIAAAHVLSGRGRGEGVSARKHLPTGADGATDMVGDCRAHVRVDDDPDRVVPAVAGEAGEHTLAVDRVAPDGVRGPEQNAAHLAVRLGDVQLRGVDDDEQFSRDGFAMCDVLHTNSVPVIAILACEC